MERVSVLRQDFSGGRTGEELLCRGLVLGVGEELRICLCFLLLYDIVVVQGGWRGGVIGFLFDAVEGRLG